MSQFESGHYSGPTMSPPRVAGAMPAEPTTWPMVIGIIGIIFACFGILNGCWGAVSPWAMEQFANALPQHDVDQMEMMRKWRHWIAGSSALGVVVAIVLLLGSIQLLKRRRGARTAIITWSILKFVLSFATSILVYVMYEDQMEAIKNDPDVAQAPTGLLEMLGPVMAIFNFAWYAALPIFMLVWFSRKKIRTETTQWT